MTGFSSLSLERKLPLLISVLLISLAGGLTAAGYHEVRQASELRGIERMQRLTSQLAELSSNNLRGRYESLQQIASDPAVVRYLSGGESDEAARLRARAALRGLAVNPADTALVAELRSVREMMTSVATSPELATDQEPVTALTKRLAGGRPALGDFYARGDSVFYLLGAPVFADNRLVGYLLQRRSIAANPRTEQLIRDLNGNDSVSILFASDSGSTWATLSGRPITVPTVRMGDDAPNVIRYERESRKYVAVYAHIANTPFRLIAETPYSSFLERSSTYLRRSISVAVLMVVLGISSAWWLSRRITRPLRGLTVAAEAISTGHYGHRAAVGRRDETGRLAEAFNAMAEQVQRSHETLERQIAESRTLATRLEEANRAKADFLATMSHELRTPLNAIGGYVDLMELGLRGPLTDDQRSDLERVRHNQRQLLALIGNILDFTRIDAQKLPFDIGSVRADVVVAETIDSVAALLDEKELQRACIGCDAPLLLRADRGRLEQILLNLLSNAVRFTPAGGRITVSLAARDQVAEIAVTDTGIGIPNGKLEAIFEPFYQVQSGLTRTVGGTGLGLTISRALARAMGGDLTASNGSEGGAIFTLTLPLAVATDVPATELAAVATG